MPNYTVYTAYGEKRPTIPAPTGDGTETTYFYQINKDGEKVLVPNGKDNVYEQIQASLEGTKIENIIKRYTMGDEEALNAVVGTYADVTALPNTLVEIKNMMLKAENDFNTLPLEIRAKFDHSFDKYVTTMGSKEWLSIMTPQVEKAEQEEKTE